LSSHVIFKLLGGGLAGIATSMLFIWGHDAAHGALFKSEKVAEFFGTIAMLPSLNTYRLWVYGHNKSHHGFTSLTTLDWVWRPLTRAEYTDLSRWKRFWYRLERSLLGCAWHYIHKIWWNVMVRSNPGRTVQQRREYRNSKLFVLAYALIMSILAFFFAGGLLGIVCVVILPFIVFNYFIAFFVYLHHTHPDIPFIDQKKQWSHPVGYLYCSTVIHTSKLWQTLMHHIMIHTPHHVDMRIPFYNLPQAYEALKSNYGQYIHEYNFSWKEVSKIFKNCKLYDYDKHQWSSFKAQPDEHEK
jgi:omega-6 fatty acid desaturase (delta-12 desaturase)